MASSCMASSSSSRETLLWASMSTATMVTLCSLYRAVASASTLYGNACSMFAMVLNRLSLYLIAAATISGQVVALGYQKIGSFL